MVRSMEKQGNKTLIKFFMIVTIIPLLFVFSSFTVSSGAQVISQKEEIQNPHSRRNQTEPFQSKEEWELSSDFEEVIRRKTNHLLDEELIESLSYDISSIDTYDEEMISSLLNFLEENYDLLVEYRLEGGTLEVVVTKTDQGYLFTIVVKWSNSTIQSRQVEYDVYPSIIPKEKHYIFAMQNLDTYWVKSHPLHKHIDYVKTVILRN